MSQYAHLSQLDPEWVRLASHMPQSPQAPLDQQRRDMSQMIQQKHQLWDPPYPEKGLKVTNLNIPVDGTSVPIRAYVPETKGEEAKFPLLVWLHGGAYIFGDLEFDDALLRLICVNQRVSCVNVDYRLSPENPFPIPLNDSYHATRWASENADSLSADLTKGFIIGGSSAGANMAAVITLKTRDDPSFKPKLSGQILQIPIVCPPAAYPPKCKGELLSIEQNKDAPNLNSKMVEGMLAAYNPPDLASPDVAPLVAVTHKNLPPAYLQICGADPLRDDGFAYEKVLRESGNATKFDVYPGLPHIFHEIQPQMEQSKKFLRDVQKGLEWILYGN